MDPGTLFKPCLSSKLISAVATQISNLKETVYILFKEIWDYLNTLPLLSSNYRSLDFCMSFTQSWGQTCQPTPPLSAILYTIKTKTMGYAKLFSPTGTFYFTLGLHASLRAGALSCPVHPLLRYTLQSGLSLLLPPKHYPVISGKYARQANSV